MLLTQTYEAIYVCNVVVVLNAAMYLQKQRLSTTMLPITRWSHHLCEREKSRLTHL